MMYTFIYKLPINGNSTINFKVIDFENFKVTSWLYINNPYCISIWRPTTTTSYDVVHKAFQGQGPSPFPTRRYIVEDAEHSLSLTELVDKYPEYFI